MRQLLLSAAILMSVSSFSFSSGLVSGEKEAVKSSAHTVDLEQLFHDLEHNPNKIATNPQLQRDLIGYLYLRGFEARFYPQLEVVLPSLTAEPFQDYMSTWVYIRLQQTKNAPIPQSIVDQLMMVATARVPEAQYVVGWLYDYGWKTPEGLIHESDPTTAYTYYLMSAEQGYGQAQGTVGWMAYVGWFDAKNKTYVQGDKEVGLKWLRAGAEQGNPYAKSCLKTIG